MTWLLVRVQPGEPVVKDATLNKSQSRRWQFERALRTDKQNCTYRISSVEEQLATNQCLPGVRISHAVLACSVIDSTRGSDPLSFGLSPDERTTYAGGLTGKSPDFESGRCSFEYCPACRTAWVVSVTVTTLDF